MPSRTPPRLLPGTSSARVGSAAGFVSRAAAVVTVTPAAAMAAAAAAAVTRLRAGTCTLAATLVKRGAAPGRGHAFVELGHVHWSRVRGTVPGTCVGSAQVLRSGVRGTASDVSALALSVGAMLEGLSLGHVCSGVLRRSHARGTVPGTCLFWRSPSEPCPRDCPWEMSPMARCLARFCSGCFVTYVSRVRAECALEAPSRRYGVYRRRMARRARCVLPAYARFHVTVRGVDRQNIVRDDFDRTAVVSGIVDAENRFGWLLHAYSLLDNHFHLVVECLRELLSAGMHRLNGLYAQRFNRRHGRIGHLFQERFGSRVIDDDEGLGRAYAYVFANPERAGLCAPGDVWPWSGGILYDDAPAEAHAAPPASAKRVFAGERVANHQRMHLVRPLVREHRLEVVHVADHGVLECDPVAAEDRARGPTDVERAANVPHLPHADVLWSQRPVVLHPSEVESHERPAIQLERHLRELLLRQLIRRDRLLEHEPLLRVVQRRLEARAAGADCAPDDSVTRLVQAGQRAAEARDFREAILLGHADVPKHELGGHRSAQRELPLHLGRRESRHPLLDEEAVDGALVRACPHNRDIGNCPVRDPHLCAIEDPVGAVAAGVRSHRSWIRARIRLGQPEATNRVSLVHRRQPPLLLFLRAPPPDREHRERALHRAEAADSGVARLELHAREPVGDGTCAGEPVAVQVHAEEAELRELLRQLAGEDRGLEPVADLGQDALAHELPHGVADRPLLVVQQRVDREEVTRVERCLLRRRDHAQIVENRRLRPWRTSSIQSSRMHRTAPKAGAGATTGSGRRSGRKSSGRRCTSYPPARSRSRTTTSTPKRSG